MKTMTHTDKNGTVYNFSNISTWTTIMGQKITSGRLNVFNKKDNHGWNGECTLEKWNNEIINR